MTDDKIATIRIPLIWDERRRWRRLAELSVLAAAALVLLTLPLLWVDAVLWLMGLAAALVALILIVKWLLTREELADIRTNGPFIEIDGTEIRFPDRLVSKFGLPQRVALADVTVRAWHVRSIYSNGLAQFHLAAFLEVVGGGIDLVLGEGNQTGAMTLLEKVDTKTSLARMAARAPVAVDGQPMVRAALALQAAQKARASNAARAAARGAERLERAMAAMQRGAAVRAAREAGTPPPAPPAPAKGSASSAPNAVNIQTLMSSGRLQFLPSHLIDDARAWRGVAGGTLLHDLVSNRALDALLAAGLDPKARDQHGRTALMVYGRSATANRQLIEAGAPLAATCDQGHTAVWYQAVAPGFGFVEPDYAGVRSLIAAGLPPPGRAEVEEWKKLAQRSVTSGTEHHAWLGYCAWLDSIARAPRP